MRTEGKSHRSGGWLLYSPCACWCRCHRADFEWDIVHGGQYKYICAKQLCSVKMKLEWLMLTETTLCSVALLHLTASNTSVVLPGYESQINCCGPAGCGNEVFPGKAAFCCAFDLRTYLLGTVSSSPWLLLCDFLVIFLWHQELIGGLLRLLGQEGLWSWATLSKQTSSGNLWVNVALHLGCCIYVW